MSDYENYEENLVFNPEQLSMPGCDIEELQKKLDRAIAVLEVYADESNWDDGWTENEGQCIEKGLYVDNGYLDARDVLQEIKG